MTAPLQAPRIDGARIGVIIESKFIPEEIGAYLSGFPLLGAEVELVSRIWYGASQPPSALFYSDLDPLDDPPWASPQKLEVKRDISQVCAADFAAVIMSANYTSVRLRFPEELPSDPAHFDPWTHVRSAPVVAFFRKAMCDKRLVKGFLCHGLWVLTPNPKLLEGRRVICHSVVMADVLNCGAQIVLTQDRVVTDEDLVTGFSMHQTLPFIAAIARSVASTRTSVLLT
jgi:protease I